ncbi:hydantoinase/oxoprolinase family protein [Enterococcus raffinosus]|uniref:Hydantoinase/oxoprolinase family protein n=1 Tax=Enterococcus raffinosus TaxID=71452 RepID=A0AAW8T967_9ENTE|nr:hydantoinase/oxoprolinase family protein [Enterococcus raffinosus]MDT2521752.1 hydantoinase/oxoprolinase family protein [Enterococcus raffinosus]MDT2529061.1 hydantoinase/oxoprolinase family protein [Enterococcus raffinosus]MDT2532733.1 hydantoinase/oxoprolinase family protein [Enterococcus raffinosus]MDT2544400.1 hydantoinase/oxoprolinase family protein [Enterococcus raffinosus]MDT2554690.1 hydantoinase/oxoprolinase family protein [Enterococcus raffinosus]
MKRRVRIGIDVGGTHTKAVAINNDTQEIIGKSSVKTTHDNEKGVAEGVVNSFLKCLKDYNIDPEEVVFVAHSTTQATNALLEGDVAKIGIISTAKPGIEGWLARIQSNLKDIDLGTGRSIHISSRFVTQNELKEEKISTIIDELLADGMDVLVASAAFGVDDLCLEEQIAEVGRKKGIPVTLASEMTKLYGLSRRTRTATINASILPKMLETANSTEESVRSSGVDVPLMIMRGDGGLMDVVEMKKRPVLTMLSGPAASVMGALMYLRTSNGIYFEVGGTSTNLGVIKNGRPVIDYSEISGHKTYVNSLDVRVLGVAGGSIIRVNKSGVKDVGPRSAHIAGLEYAVYTPEEEIVDPKLELYSPKEGDPADYVAIRLASGKCITITNSCAANVLGYVTEEDFSYGNVASARKAMTPLADYLNTTVEDVARQILSKAVEKIEPVIRSLAKKYQLEKNQMTLVGVGGGVAALIKFAAERMELNYKIPENAEVISSIGVALAAVQDVVERIVPNPTKQDIQAIKQEVTDMAIESGATEDSVEVHIEIDPQTQKITARASGSTAAQATEVQSVATETEAREIAVQDFRLPAEEVQLLDSTDHFYVYGANSKKGNGVRVIDKKGFIRVQREHAEVVKTSIQNYFEQVTYLWESMANYQSDLIIRPDFYFCVGPRLLDFSSTDFTQLTMLMEIEMSEIVGAEEMMIIAANRYT